MEVIIREKAYEYISDFNNGWTYSAGDYFKFPVKIGRNHCFIKRFDKSKPENISGWHLLKGLKAHYEPGLPRLHDIVETLENGKRIYYVFYEYLEGQTLGSAIGKGPWVDLEKLTEQVFQALGSIHKHQHWFADFCEKNIFCTAAGSYFLIDLDSAQPSTALPENDMYADKEYWALAFTYIVHEAGYKHFKPADISGILLNYLQAIFLLLRVKIGLIDGKMEYKSEDLFRKLPQLLQQWAPEYKDIFTTLMDRVPQLPDESDVKKIKEVLLEKIVRRTADYSVEEESDMDRIEGVKRLGEPAIRRFDADKAVLKGGGAFRLSWETENADHIELYRYKVLYRKLDKATREITLKEVYDGQEKKVRYALAVYNDHGHAKSAPVEISVVEVGRKGADTESDADIVRVIVPGPVIDNQSERPIGTKGDIEKLTREKSIKEKLTKEKPIKEQPVIVRRKEPIVIAWRVVFLTVGVLAVAAILAFWLINSFAAKPALYGFQPKKMAGPGEVILYGEHFPGNKNAIKVLFDTLQGTITSATDEKLVVQMPSLGNNNLKASVKLVVRGNALQARESLSYEPHSPEPVVSSVVGTDTNGSKIPVRPPHPDPIHRPKHDRSGDKGSTGQGTVSTTVATNERVNTPPKPPKNNLDLDTADIAPIDNIHAILEAKLKSESLKINSEPYRTTLGVFGRRRKVVFYNQSPYVLNWVKLAIDQEAGGGSEIRILRNVKPHATIILVDNLDKNSPVKGTIRSIHLEK